MSPPVIQSIYTIHPKGRAPVRVQVVRLEVKAREPNTIYVTVVEDHEYSNVWSVKLSEWGDLNPTLSPGTSGTRPSWDAYFIEMCHLVATRATCDRKHVGAVLVRDRHVRATGYNGSAPSEPHCDDVGHDLVTLADGKVNCVRTIHAEANAILQAAKYGVSVLGTTLYTNTYPCWPCAKMILGVGIVEVVVDVDYNNDARVDGAFAAKGIVVRRYKHA